eukprot:TRINITY_DN3644_c3_g1_i1.p3 TRINITY_DN3644_c3_g1~~TRINITY_DN3644_c3_g1_i1.p3  ORF type:complete len:294 (+),score=92.06 TRINITY_DN3644_c3_g1_i1:70-882(+)
MVEALGLLPRLVPETGDAVFDAVVGALPLLGLLGCAAELFGIPAAYGRYGGTMGPTVDPRLGWWIMELPCWGVFLACVGGPLLLDGALCPRLLCGMYLLHYAYRGWAFPLLMRPSKQSGMALLVAFGGAIVTIPFGYLNAKWWSVHGTHLSDPAWMRSPRFVFGFALYYCAFFGTVYHDSLMRNARRPGMPRYSVLRGGLFEYVTCAHYLCELLSFAGFALMDAGPGRLFILAVSTVNLVPRARTTHRWYREHFGAQYPAERKALVPFLL